MTDETRTSREDDARLVSARLEAIALTNEKTRLEVEALRAATTKPGAPREPRALTWLGWANSGVAMLAAIAGLRACDEAQSAKLVAVEAEARVQGRLSPQVSLGALEHLLGVGNGIYDLKATFTAGAAGAQPIAIQRITYELWARPDGPDVFDHWASNDGGVSIFGIGAPPSLGPYPGSQGDGYAPPLQARWEQIDHVVYPTPEGEQCNVTTGVPYRGCQLNGVGIYSQGETLLSSRTWKLALPRAMEVYVFAKVDWCKYDSQQDLNDARSSTAPLRGCKPQTSWTAANSLVRCGYEDFDRCTYARDGGTDSADGGTPYGSDASPAPRKESGSTRR